MQRRDGRTLFAPTDEGAWGHGADERPLCGDAVGELFREELVTAFIAYIMKHPPN